MQSAYIPHGSIQLFNVFMHDSMFLLHGPQRSIGEIMQALRQCVVGNMTAVDEVFENVDILCTIIEIPILSVNTWKFMSECSPISLKDVFTFGRATIMHAS